MKNKKIFITGATSGLGKMIATMLEENEVYATGRNRGSA